MLCHWDWNVFSLARCPDFFCLLIASSGGPSCFIIILYDVVPAKFLPFTLGFPCTPRSHYTSCPPAAISACWWSSIVPPPAGTPVLTRCLHRRLLHTPVHTHTDGFYTRDFYTHVHTHRRLLHTYTHSFYTLKASTHIHTRLLHTHGFYIHTYTVFGPLLPGRGEFFIYLGVCAHICTNQM